MSRWPEREPKPRNRSALICFTRSWLTADITFWDTPAEAREASAELAPCSRLCVSAHSVCEIRDDGTVHTHTDDIRPFEELSRPTRPHSERYREDENE